VRPILIAFVELKRYVRDPGQLAFSILLPVALVAVMVGAFGGGTSFRGTATIVDLGPSEASQELRNRIEAVEGVSLELVDEAKADRWLEGSARLLVTVIPADFGARLDDPDSPPALDFRLRGNGGQEGQVILSVVQGILDQMASEVALTHRVQDAMAGSGASADAIRAAVDRALAAEKANPAVVLEEVTFGGGTDYVDLFLPGVITMMTLFAVTMNAQAIVEERTIGTLERLMTTGVSTGGLFTGKYLANFARGFAQVLILISLGWIAFRSFGPATYAEVLVVGFVLVACASAVGVLIAAAARTPDQATWVSVVVTLVMSTIGGSFFELPDSGFIHVLSHLSINRYGNVAMTGLLSEGNHLDTYWGELAVLAIVTVVVVALARPLFSALQAGQR